MWEFIKQRLLQFFYGGVARSRKGLWDNRYSILILIFIFILVGGLQAKGLLPTITITEFFVRLNQALLASCQSLMIGPMLPLDLAEAIKGPSEEQWVTILSVFFLLLLVFFSARLVCIAHRRVTVPIYTLLERRFYLIAKGDPTLLVDLQGLKILRFRGQPATASSVIPEARRIVRAIDLISHTYTTVIQSRGHSDSFYIDKAALVKEVAERNFKTQVAMELFISERLGQGFIAELIERGELPPRRRQANRSMQGALVLGTFLGLVTLALRCRPKTKTSGQGALEQLPHLDYMVAWRLLVRQDDTALVNYLLLWTMPLKEDHHLRKEFVSVAILKIASLLEL